MRYYKETTKEDFLESVKNIMCGDEFPYEMTPAMEKDLEKVNFDWENYTSYDEEKHKDSYPIGYKELKPGFHIYLSYAGGDWELPVCYIFYNSENGLRAYIPKDGNVWNKKEKCAYGSENNREGDFDFEEIWKKEFNEEKIYQDILNRIILK